MISFYFIWLASGFLFQMVMFKLKSIEIMISTEDDPKKVIAAYNRHAKLFRCTVCFLFVTAIAIILGAGTMIVFGLGISLPDWVFWTIASMVTAFAVACMALVIRMLFFFTQMGMNYLNILEVEQEVKRCRMQCGFIALAIFCFVDALRGSGMLATLVFTTVINLVSVSGYEPTNDVCTGWLHPTLYFLYWWQVVQPLVYSSVVLAIVYILAKAQENELAK